MPEPGEVSYFSASAADNYVYANATALGRRLPVEHVLAYLELDRSAYKLKTSFHAATELPSFRFGCCITCVPCAFVA